MSEELDIDEENLTKGLLSLVLALVEVIRDVLKLQALKRMEAGRLSEDEVNRLGQALKELDAALEGIKEDQDLQGSVSSVREGLNDLVSEAFDPRTWETRVD